MFSQQWTSSRGSGVIIAAVAERLFWRPSQTGAVRGTGLRA
jgi:hypothetical protein